MIVTANVINPSTPQQFNGGTPYVGAVQSEQRSTIQLEMRTRVAPGGRKLDPAPHIMVPLGVRDDRRVAALREALHNLWRKRRHQSEWEFHQETAGPREPQPHV